LHPATAPPQIGVVPEHGTHDGPQAEVDVHEAQVVPTHWAPRPHEPLGAGSVLQMQPVDDPPHSGVVPEQATQDGPQ